MDLAAKSARPPARPAGGALLPWRPWDRKKAPAALPSARSLPANWVGQLVAQGGWARVGGLTYPRVTALQQQSERYFARPAADKRGDARGDVDEAGYGEGARGREWLFVRDRGVPAPLAAEVSALWTWCHALSLACMSRIAVHLGLDEAAYLALVEEGLSLPTRPNDSLLRMFHYGGVAEQNRETEVVTAPHRDVGLLAIGLRTAPGLQTLSPGKAGWRDVERSLAAGAVVVMVGDSLAALTNYRVPSCTHRVVSGRVERFSWVYHLRLKRTAWLDAGRLASVKTGPFSAAAEPCLAGELTRYLLSSKKNANQPLGARGNARPVAGEPPYVPPAPPAAPPA